MASSLIKLRQIDTTELAAWLQQYLAGTPTPSGYTFDEDIIPLQSGLQSLGDTSGYWANLYANSITLPSGSGINFGNQFFTTSGNSLIIRDGLGGTTIISSTTQYVTYIGPSGAPGPTGATGAVITGAVPSGDNSVVFYLSDGSNTNPVALPSGSIGPSGNMGPSGASVTGAVTGSDITGEYFQFLFSNGNTGKVIYIPSGLPGRDGEIGGVTISFYGMTGLFTGEQMPYVHVNGIADAALGGPTINLLKGFSYRFGFSGINSLYYNADSVTQQTNFIAYGSNDTIRSMFVGSEFQNGNGNPLTDVSNSGVLLFTLFTADTQTGRYLWNDGNAPALSTVQGNVVDINTVFEDYAYIPETLQIAGSGYDFYWKTNGAVRFSDSIATGYKYGFALYNPDPSNPPVLADSPAFYVLGDIALSYAPLAGPQGLQGIQGIPGPGGGLGPSGGQGPTGIGVSGLDTIVTDGILNGFRFVLTDGSIVGPYFIPTGGAMGPSGGIGPSGNTGATGVSVTGVIQDNPSGIRFSLSNGNTTSEVSLPVGPMGLADRYSTSFYNSISKVSGQISYPTGFYTGSDGVNWTVASGAGRVLKTGIYMKIYDQPTDFFAGMSYTPAQKLVFAKVGAYDSYFQGDVVSFDGHALTVYIDTQLGAYTTPGLSILNDDTVAGLISVNLSSAAAVGPTGISVTGIESYTSGGAATGIQFQFSNSTTSPVFALPVGPRGPAGTNQVFNTVQSGVDTSMVPNQLLRFDTYDMYDLNVTGDGTALQVSFHSGTVSVGQVFSVLLRNSGIGTTNVSFYPNNQIYYVNGVPPAFPATPMMFNIYTFQRGNDYNNGVETHPVYYCTYAANYPALN
jgi:hypothetical protein